MSNLLIHHCFIFLQQLFIFLCYLSPIIIFHELAHFIVAKKMGCQINIVSLGFGKPFYKKLINNTYYQICPILLGGYCQLKDELNSGNDKDSFSNLPYLKKVAIAIAGCAINIGMGIPSYYLGTQFDIWFLFYFGYLSIILGVTNLIPIIPCLDGGYIFYIPILSKIFGKEKGIKVFEKINQVSFIIMIILNILCLPYIFYLIWIGKMYV